MKPWKKYVFTGLAAAALIFGWWLASPLFLDKKVNEELPAQAAAEMKPATDMQKNASVSSETEMTPPDAMSYSGEFKDADKFHSAAGQAFTVRSGDLTYLRFERFKATNGPDLYVYLAIPGSSTAEGIELGKLKGNIGDQNYELPKDIDLSRYSTVVIYCKAFSVDFGYAELKPL